MKITITINVDGEETPKEFIIGRDDENMDYIINNIGEITKETIEQLINQEEPNF